MSAEFMDCFRLSMMEQQAAREQDRAAWEQEREERKAAREQEREERREDRKDLMTVLTAFAPQGVAVTYDSNKKRKTRDNSD